MAGCGLRPFLEHGDVIHEGEGAEPAGESDFLREVAEPAADVGTLGGNGGIKTEHVELPLRRRQRSR